MLELVWATLTDYPNLALVVPNLVSNDVLSTDDDGKGARLQQVGAAKIGPGITFKAQTTLDVREWPGGLPADKEADYLAEAEQPVGEYGVKESAAARVASQLQPLQLGVFPRPYVLSSLPHRDVTMQGAVDVKGDFRFYQGVWRLQELPNCAQPGYSAMRLTYSVELSPRAWVPVALLEGNIATALGENLEAIRDYVVASDGCLTEY